MSLWPAGREHFRAEEEVLLPAYAGHATVSEDPAVARVLLDHVTIRHLATQLERHADTPLETLHALGGVLGEHVRFEERRLFPRIEAALPADELALLADALDRSSEPSNYCPGTASARNVPTTTLAARNTSSVT